MRGRAILTALILVLAVGVAGAEQVRLRTGDLLQGEILKDQADDTGFSFRLFRTGGVFRLRWDQLIEDDEKRFRDLLGLSPWDEGEVLRIPGHQVLLTDGTVLIGVAENPDETDQPLKLKTSTTVQPIPRDLIAGIRKTMVDALEVYTSEQLYEMFKEEMAPETPGQHLELAKLCVQVDAHRQAMAHLETALADADFADSDEALLARNLLEKVKILIRAEDALDRKRSIKRLAFQKRYQQALDDIKALREEYEESPAIRKLLNLDRLQREIVSARRKYFLSEVRRRFFKVMDQLVKEKLREKDENGESIGIRAIQQWVSNPRSLTAEIFSKIAEQTGLDEQEAKEFWDGRKKGQPKRFNYGGGTFIHPDERERARKALTPTRKTGGRSSGGRRNSARRSKGPRLKSDSEWWSSVRSAEVKKNFVKAWFAEFGPGVLTVLRIETRSCKNCGGKGIQTTHSINSSEEVRTICPVCNLAGHERIVICR